MPLRMSRPSGSGPDASCQRHEKGKRRMFRPPLGSFVLLVVVLALLGSLAPTAAQETTPASEQAAGTPEAATFRALAAGLIEVLAPSTANLVLGRISLAPEASLPFDPADPSAILVYVASGELTFRV